MHHVIAKTFGGLSGSYYFRHFLFSLIFPALLLGFDVKGAQPTPWSMVALMAVNSLLYPYSRFVYERITGFIMGENVFFVNAFLMLAAKVFSMALCWCFAVIVAPIGLAYLYFHHTRAEREQ